MADSGQDPNRDGHEPEPPRKRPAGTFRPVPNSRSDKSYSDPTATPGTSKDEVVTPPRRYAGYPAANYKPEGSPAANNRPASNALDEARQNYRTPAQNPPLGTPGIPARPPRLFQPPGEPPPERPPRKSGLNYKKIPWGVILGYTGLTALIIGSLIGLFAFTRVYGFLQSISTEPVTGNNGQTVVQPGISGKGKVNVVLLGLDKRPNDNEGTRSDTLILLSVDQDSKAVSLLSVPRDLWVKIPGRGNNRVNTAYFFGDQDQPGKGGPSLVKETILQNFGIKVDYFVEVDFSGFRSIVDALGGVNLDVKKPLIDNEYPTEDFGIKRIYIPAGFQRMNGQTALEYARSRHADSDLGRNQRQQEVLLALLGARRKFKRTYQ